MASLTSRPISTFVSSDYLIQVSRVRQHLNQFRDEFLSLPYVNGIGDQKESAYNIWVNLCLITSKVRPAFMIQWVDYIDPAIFQRIMNLLVRYRDGLSDRDLDYRLLFLSDPRGVIVTTYYTYYKQNVRDIYARYVITDYNDEFLLGTILGYPAAGEVVLEPGDLQYLNRNERPPGQRTSDPPPANASRHIFSILVVTYGSGTQQIFSNIYRSPPARVRLYDFFNKVVETMKLYDPESYILVEDDNIARLTLVDIESRKFHGNFLDSQGQLLPSDRILQFSESKKAVITESQRSAYKQFINSTERKKENWNTEFDRIFELGYSYRT